MFLKQISYKIVDISQVSKIQSKVMKTQFCSSPYIRINESGGGVWIDWLRTFDLLKKLFRIWCFPSGFRPCLKRYTHSNSIKQIIYASHTVKVTFKLCEGKCPVCCKIDFWSTYFVVWHELLSFHNIFDSLEGWDTTKHRMVTGHKPKERKF